MRAQQTGDQDPGHKQGARESSRKGKHSPRSPWASWALQGPVTSETPLSQSLGPPPTKEGEFLHWLPQPSHRDLSEKQSRKIFECTRGCFISVAALTAKVGRGPPRGHSPSLGCRSFHCRQAPQEDGSIQLLRAELGFAIGNVGMISPNQRSQGLERTMDMRTRTSAERTDGVGTPWEAAARLSAQSRS